MKHSGRITTRMARLLLPSVATVLLVSSASAAAPAQEDDKPITRELLMRALKPVKNKQLMTAAQYVKVIKRRGVDFCMTDEDEQEIREVGAYMGAAGLDDLVAAVREGCVRLGVFLFKYDPCDREFAEFKTMLASKLRVLQDKFISKDNRYGYIAKLTLVHEEKPFPASRDEVDRYWRKTRSLQLLRGLCKKGDDDVYTAHSQVFLGNLCGSLDTTVRVDFKIHVEEFSTTKDMHSVLVLYSLAQEAKARGRDKDLIISYLSEALKIAAQIGNQDATLLSIESAINGMFQELGVSPAGIPARLRSAN
jgi:hypothetical protein